MGRIADMVIESKKNEDYKNRIKTIGDKTYITHTKSSIEHAFEKPINEIPSKKIF